ncbi:MAG: GNAT family N-acetyltransferase [Methylobacter sp.]|nr:MAG: GNAT family N-acetyltransferase [Methylobacter sp.]PPD23103.1 MAG: GNAT family N-acetyltransferase [Methylobacter sp.]PPD31990.1 MAG: GNAT family N-acetyltransferase [Methylomonas sp.]
MMELEVTQAAISDAEALVGLINSAYRGDSSRQGWTTEADLLDGRRIDLTGILALLADANCVFIIARQNGKLMGSVQLQRSNQFVQFSMLAVEPGLQGKGTGKRLLFEAEQTAHKIWGITHFIMDVISLRSELIAFYQRCGYRKTAMYHDFPPDCALWTAKVSGLQLERLEKRL